MCVFIHIETHIHNKERRDSEFEREWKWRIWGRRRDENDVNLVHTHGISNKIIKKKDLC